MDECCPRHLAGLALVARAGVTNPPERLSGAALLKDIEAAGELLTRATHFSKTYVLTKSDLLDFENAVDALRHARDALNTVLHRPIYQAAFCRGFEHISNSETQEAAQPNPYSQFGCPPPFRDMDGPLRLEAIRWELAAFMLAGEHGLEILKHDSKLNPMWKSLARRGHSTVYECLVAEDLPQIFETHLKRECKLWTGDTGVSIGIKFVQGALEHLNYEVPSPESLKKAIQRYRHAMKQADEAKQNPD